MAITVSFSISQVVGAPQNIVITDSSTGSDVTATSRHILITNSAGQYITESGIATAVAYTTWALGTTTKTLSNILSTDTAFIVTLNYVDVNGATVATDTSATPVVCSLYGEQFYYGLTNTQSSNPSILQDNNYYANKMQLRVLLDSANQAANLGNDISSSQSCLDAAAALISDSNAF